MKYRIYWALSLVLIPSAFQCGQQPEIQIENRDLENLAIIDEIHPITLEKALNTCATSAGKAYFKESLRHLSADCKTLEARQSDLKILATNPQALTTVRKLTQQCAASEHILDQFSSKTFPLEEFCFHRAPFVRLNGTSSALTASFFLHYVHLFAPLIEHALLHAGINSVFSKLTDSHDHHGHSHEHHHHHACACSHAHGLSKTDLAYYAIQAAHWGMHIPGYYEILTHMQTRRAKIVTAQKTIASLKSYLEAVHELYDHVSALHPDFVVQHAPTLQRIFSMDRNHDDGAAMINTILTTSWGSSVQNTLMPGAIIAMYESIYRNRFSILESLVDEIGVIDSYVHVASLLAECNEKKPYCFVQFVSQQTPMVHLENLWHHAIKSDTMRPLTIAISKEYGCMIVQGANGSGKSTMLTALGHALFLAQSWGIAPASSATMTPFATIYTHSLKRDAIERGLSHFYTEHAYYESMFTRNSRGLSIALLDEPYTCTDATTGTNYLSDLVQRIEDSHERTAVITTHYALQYTVQK